MDGDVRVPVKVGLLNGAFESNAVCVAVDIGFDKSVVLSTLLKATIDFVIPVTVPVNAGLFIGAFACTDVFVA